MSRESRSYFESDASGEGKVDPAAASEPEGSRSGDSESARAAQELDVLRKRLAEAEEQARAQRDLYLRAAAELENVRKRAQRDMDQAQRYAIEGFAAELLPVRDSLELAVRNGAAADAQTLLDGQEATLKLLQRAFEKFSIRLIDPVGQRFDPNLHEAVLMQEAGGAAPNSVLQVVQPGYELNGRLLRPARVIVARSSAGGA